MEITAIFMTYGIVVIGGQSRIYLAAFLADAPIRTIMYPGLDTWP